jgi:alpha-1,6-mannosyltransferase
MPSTTETFGRVIAGHADLESEAAPITASPVGTERSGGGRLRIVDVTQWYSPTSGGIRTYLHAKAAWAARSGEAHAAIVTGESAGCVRVAGSPFLTLRGVTPSRRWGYRLAPWPPAVVRALERLSPGLVVIHDALAFPGTIVRWAESRNVPVVLFCHSDLSLGSAGLPRRLVRPVGRALAAVQRRALRLAKVVLVASETTESAVRPQTRSRVIRSPLGVDLADFAGAEPDPELRRRLAPGGRQLVIHAGRLTSDKRVDLLVPMLAALPGGVVLAIAGYGPMEGRIVRQARAAGVADRLVMLGHIADRRELARTLATADCFVHPNPREPFGLGPLEALAAGCRVVAPASGGTGETLRGRGAVLVRPGDPGALAAGVLRALSGPRPHPDLSDLSWDATFSREWAIYCEMAAAAGGRAG